MNNEEANSAYLFPDFFDENAKPKKLKMKSKKTDILGEQEVESIPVPVLPTRWEYLQRKIEDSKVPLLTIIHPVYPAIQIIRDIVEYLKITGGCQVLVIRADSGSGKTTFLNTLPHYMQDVEFKLQTIDLEPLSEEDFSSTLWKIQTSSGAINLMILEGKENPEDITDKYIQIVLSNINRFSRSKKDPLLFVIPTIEEQVARNWCNHGERIGDLIPEQKLYEGSRWYNFPGVPTDKYIEIAEETVRALNPPRTLYEFGISPDEVKNWVGNAPSIGKFMEILANKISDRRKVTKGKLKGKREHVWIVYCSPDLRHYDHSYLVIDGLVQDEKFRVSPTKLIPPDSNTPDSKSWREPFKWARLVATINFLDIRLINFPISTLVIAALTYGDDKLLQGIKKIRLKDYEKHIPDDMKPKVNKLWNQFIVERKSQVQNARDAFARSNLFSLLRGMPAEQQKGGSFDSATLLAQYLYIRDHASESDLHYYIGCALNDLLTYYQFPGFLGIETEEPLVPGQIAPIPDITIHTETDIHALEFHFLRKQVRPSDISRYATENVIDKYMKSLPHLNAILNTIES